MSEYCSECGGHHLKETAAYCERPMTRTTYDLGFAAGDRFGRKQAMEEVWSVWTYEKLDMNDFSAWLQTKVMGLREQVKEVRS